MFRPKTVLRNSLASALYAAGLTAPARRHAGKLSIVTFHRVLPAPERAVYPYPGLAVTPEELDALLGFFTRHFDCGPLWVQYDRFRSGSRTVKPLLAITFDDGQYDNYAHARPVLRRYGAHASFFIPVRAMAEGKLLWHDLLGFSLQHLSQTPDGTRQARDALVVAGLAPAKPDRNILLFAVRGAKKIPVEMRLKLVDSLVSACDAYTPPDWSRMMTSSEVAALAAEGHEIGSHSMTHCLMPECDDAALRYETAESARILAEITGQPTRSFCYPNGDVNAKCAAAVQSAGYRCAVTTAHGVNDPHSAPYTLARIDMDAARMTSGSGTISDAAIAFRLARPASV